MTIGVGMTRLEETEKWKKIQPRLEQEPLKALASQYEVSAGEIYGAMRRTGVVRQPVRIIARQELPPEPGEEMETKARRKKPSKIDPYRELVGAWPDSAIATKAGVTISAVRAFRTRYGIPAYSTQKRIEPVRPAPAAAAPKRAPLRPTKRTINKKSRSKVTAFEADLGVLTDTAIAAKAGVTVGAVRAYRIRQGIASSTENKRVARQAAAKNKNAKRAPRAAKAPPTATKAPPAPSKPPPAAAKAPVVATAPKVSKPVVREEPKPVSATTNYVWSVTYGDDKSCLVGGSDLAAAGGVLARAGIDDVYKVKRLGKLLE